MAKQSTIPATKTGRALHELIGLARVAPVVQTNAVRALRAAPTEAAVRDFVQGYLACDEQARHALDSTVSALGGEAGTGAAGGGGGWFFNGVFGAGKSHLLGVLALLAAGIGLADCGAANPHLQSALARFAPRFVVHFSLDAYDATQYSLEAAFWREVRAQWRADGLPGEIGEAEEADTPAGGARAEAFCALEAAVAAEGRSGIVLCIDELSLFLGGRDHRGLQNDAAFLQFLGQRARRRGSGNMPLWVFAALQKTVDDIGDLDAYTIAQIRDRYVTLPLSLAHLPSLIEERLVVRRDAAAVAELCESSYQALGEALPRLDFGREEWLQLFPFHPATVLLLECAATRFFSRTRSAVLFCSAALEGALTTAAETSADAGPGAEAGTRPLQRIGPTALFDFVEPALAAHPDLRALPAIWAGWQRDLETMAGDAVEAGYLRELMKALLLFKIAGIAPSCVTLTNAVALDAGLPGEGNYQYAALLLEKLREQGGSLAVERRAGSGNDRYTIDFGARVGEMARRFTANALLTLPAGDRRVAAYALACCRHEPLPLATLQRGATLPAYWRNTPRRIAVEIAMRPPAPEVVVNRLAALGAPDADDLCLWLLPPFVREEQPETGLAQQWGEAMREAARGCSEVRRRAALLWWVPRAPSQGEWQLAREATAQQLLLRDPQLADNRRGRAVLEHLKNGAAAREAALGNLACRLLREGTIASGHGMALEASELAGAASWAQTLEALAELALPAVYPQAGAVAPRLRLLTCSNSEALCLELLRRPAHSPHFAASLERVVRAVAAPLGVAHEEKGRWNIGGGDDALRLALCDFVSDAEGATPAAIENHFAHSAWGLDADQTRVLLCALLRSGELAACDARGNLLEPLTLGMPLSRAVQQVRPGRLPDSAVWEKAARQLALLCAAPLGARTFDAQEQARELLLGWRADSEAVLELARARLHQLQRQFECPPAQWPQAGATVEAMGRLLQVAAPAPACDMLQCLAALEPEATAATLAAWRNLNLALETRHAALLNDHAFLTHPQLATPPALAAERAALLVALAQGEAALDDEALLARCAVWRASYAELYRQWHGAQHAAARFLGLGRLAAGDGLRAARRLGELRHRDFNTSAALGDSVALELARRCAHDGATGSEPLCPACRLRWGERLLLRDPAAIESELGAGTASLRSALAEPACAALLARSARGSALLAWAAGDNELDEALPLLDDEGLALLDEAFRPRRQVSRSFGQLKTGLAGCRSRADYESTFGVWLDGGEGLQSSDEVMLAE